MKNPQRTSLHRGRFSLWLTRKSVLILGMLTCSAAWSGVEFVTPVDQCGGGPTVRVDVIGDGKDLFVMGPSVQFEVWGNSIDLTDPVSGFRIAVDSGTANVTARILSRRSGFDNANRPGPCPFIGSAVVQVDSPPGLNSVVQRSIFFRMPLGDESRLQITIKPLPRFTATWSDFSPAEDSRNCIIGNGREDSHTQGTVHEIDLPPGHQQDSSNCLNPHLAVKVELIDDLGEVDIAQSLAYSVAGLPNFLNARTVLTAVNRARDPAVLLDIDTLRTRALDVTSDTEITVSNSLRGDRSDTLRLIVHPDAGNGFSAQAVCDPARFDVGDITDCNIRLAQAIGGAGQPITWRMTTASCFKQAVDSAPYDSAASFQVFDFPSGQSSADIRVRSVKGPGCGDVDGVTHLFEAWVGDFRTDPQATASSSGPTYTVAKIRVVDRDQ